MISNSGHDEHGRYSGGVAGDQTGKEWAEIPWYNRPWTHIVRFKEPRQRQYIAALAREAAGNDRIGYDQSQRTTFWQELRVSGYHPAQIRKPCEADCSAGVAAICKAVGYLIGDEKMQQISPDMYTGNEVAVLRRAGAEILTEAKYLRSDKYLYAGDILLCEDVYKRQAYSSLEVISRKRRMQGYNVMFPIGFDAFGLPTENYAIKTNTHPREITDQNIAKFSEQLKRVGFSFDWDRVVDTSKDDYYKWTQWIFLKLFEKGLVFRNKTLVNYCPSCKVVLSNEDSQGGKCDICHSDVVQMSKDVWYLKITEYADKLLNGLDTVEYPENIKQQQVNWIGKSTGAFVDFHLDGIDEKLEIYTTRCDTLFGVTFMVMAPEHPLIDKYADRIQNMDAIRSYRAECAKKTEFERTQLVKDKTGLKIEGLEAVNPVNGKKIPIFLADYVMMGYGTGAIMAVPAHDQRDYDFAKKFGVDIVQVIEGGDIEKEAYTGDGMMINSEFLNGFTNKKDSIARMLGFLVEKGIGHAGVQFKMKDWAFNRQRYWGEPIPLIHCPNCGVVAVPYEELPLRLPDMENFRPGEDGQSPLAKVESFVNCKCPNCGADAKRETDTMPQWAGSSWYFLRYCDCLLYTSRCV